MSLTQIGSLNVLQFSSLADNQLFHGFVSRLGGESQPPFASLNVGQAVGDKPQAVAANHQALYQAFGISAADVVSGQQVHGDRVSLVTNADRGQTLADTDALICNIPGITLLLRFADCVPLVFYTPRQRAIGLAHAGWRGTMLKIAAQTACAMIEQWGCAAEELYVGIGPSIGPCCYQVGPEVIEAARSTMPNHDELFSNVQADGRAHFDLWRMNALQLKEIGIVHIELASLCTACRHELFFSHRAEHGRTGRFAAIIGLRA